MTHEKSIVKPNDVIIIQDGQLKGKFMYVSNISPEKIIGWIMCRQKPNNLFDKSAFHLITPENDCYICFNNRKSIRHQTLLKVIYKANRFIAKDVAHAHGRYSLARQEVPLDIKTNRAAPSNYISIVRGGSCTPK